MKLEKEIIDIENFYATATIEEAIAYFKAISAKCYATVTGCADRMLAAVKSVASGLIARFAKPIPTNKLLQDELTPAMVWLNTSNPSPDLLEMLEDLDDLIGMEETFKDALEILTNKS